MVSPEIPYIQSTNPVRHEDGSTTWIVGGRVPAIRLERVVSVTEVPSLANDDGSDKDVELSGEEREIGS